VPELLNETACFIRARQREDLVPDATNRTSAVVTVGTDGLLRVEVAGAGFYSNADALATDLAQKQGALMHGILLLVDPPASPHTP